jgi:DNA-binding SARP family transcriptional activator/ABC-type transport system substrate-binding protein/streptogramin lyase
MIEFRILGPLEVQDEGRLAPLGGTRQRAVLAILLLHRGEVLSLDRLVDELWGEQPPDTATQTVQVYISRLRKELGQGAVRTRGHGYIMDVEPDQLDAATFERLTTEGRDALARGEAGNASELLREALGLWRGPPLGDLAYEAFAQSHVARLEELRLVALEHRIEADLALWEHAMLVPELETLVRKHPSRERFWAQLILALYRSGRQAKALERYRDARRALIEELGLEPGRELKELERAILTQDPELDAPARAGRAAASPRGRRGGVIVGLAGGLLLAATVAAVFAGGEGDPDTTEATPNSLAVIDPESNRLIAAIPTGIRPADVASGAGNIWVANEADDTVTQVDPGRRAVVSTTSPRVGVAGLAVGAGGVWIGGERRLVRLDPGFRTIDRSVRLVPPDEHTDYSGPNLLAVQYGSVWVGSDYGAVARVDPDTREVESVSLGNSPSAIATGAGGVWVTDDVDNTVTRIDPASANAVASTTPVGRGPSAVATGAGAVWVANTQDNTVARVDPRTAVVDDTIRVGRRPTGVAVGEGAVWVANSLSGTVSRIDPRDGRVEETIETGEAPQSLTVAHGLVWVSVQPGAASEIPKTPDRGRVARILAAEDDGPTDPALDFDRQRQSAICAQLYHHPDRPYPEGAMLRPEVAEGPPSVSDNGRTYEFRLRRGFRFSPPSNEPVTAEAFERAIERSLSPRMESFGGELLAEVVGADDYRGGRAQRITGVSARGTTLVIRLERPVPDLTARLAAPYFCAVPPNTPMVRKGVDAVPSAGPYYVASHVPGRSLVLRRNPSYDGPRPHRLAELRYRFGVPEEKAVAAVEAGRADYVEVNPPSFTAGLPAERRQRLIERYGARSEAARAGRQQLFTQPSLSTYSFVFNTRRGPFTDPRLRRAVNFAMDRHALAEHTGGSEVGQPTDQFLPPGLAGYEDVAIYPLGRPDLASARRLAGRARRKAVLYTCKLPGCTRHAQILKSNLRAIGIELEVRQFLIPELFPRLEDPSEPFDIGYSNWFVDYADPSGYINAQYAREGGIRPALFDDPDFERRMAAAADLTGDARLRADAKLDRDLAADAAPAATFATGVSTYFLSARMGCQVLHPIYGLDLAALCVRRR